jgi:hypothetical protein
MAKVIRQFRETSHEDHIYNEGDTYPAKGFKADAERVSFLSKQHPTFGVAFLSVEEEKEVSKEKIEQEKDDSGIAEKAVKATSKNKASAKK